MDPWSAVPAALVALLWALRELAVVLQKRYSRSERPPPPLPRSEMPTPTAGFGMSVPANQSGSYSAVPAADQYVTRGELGELAKELRQQYAGVSTAIADLAQVVGHLEGVINARFPRR